MSGLIFKARFLNNYCSGVLPALAWLVPHEKQSYARPNYMTYPSARQKHSSAAKNSPKHKDQNLPMYTCAYHQKCNHYLAVGVDSKVSEDTQRRAVSHHDEKPQLTNYRGGLPMALSRCSCCTRSMFYRS